MRIALGVEYDGSNFFGWQTQENLPTVQSTLEIALSHIAHEPIRVFCAGRTDARVHGVGQVVHFDTQAIRALRAWTMGVNTHLPPTIAVQWAKEVDETFHARFSAISRRYRYIIHNHPLRSAILATRATWYYRPLAIEPMQQAAAYLVGEHDFSAFRAAQCESKSPQRNIHEIKILRQDNLVIIEIEANAFLHHMVRNIVGVLLQIGSGQKEPTWMLQVLHSKDRRTAADTAPAAGLYLTQVNYPENYALPNRR